MRDMSHLLFVFFFVAHEASAQHISFLRAERISPNSLSSRVSVPFHSGVVVIDLPQNALRLPNYENQRRPRRLKSESSSHRSRSFEMFSPPLLINEGRQSPWTPVTSESKLYRKRKSEKYEWPSELNEISSPYGDPSDQYTLFVPAAAQTTRVNSINEQLPSYKPRSSQPLPPAPVQNRRSNSPKPQMMIPFSMPVSSMKPASQQQSRPKQVHPSSSVTGHSAGMSFEDNMRLQELAPLFVRIESGPMGRPRMQGRMKGHSEDLIPQDLLEQIISEIIPKIEAEKRSRRQQSQESVAQGQKMNSPRNQRPSSSSNDEGYPYLMNPDEGFNSPPEIVPKPRPFPSFKTNVQSFKMSKTNVPQAPMPQPPSKTSPAKPPTKGGYSPPPQQQVQQQEQAPEPQAKGYPQPAPQTKSAPRPQPQTKSAPRPQPQTKSAPPPPPPPPRQPTKGFTPMTPRSYSMPPPPPPQMATKGGYAPPPPPVKGPAPRPVSKGPPPTPSKTAPPPQSKTSPPSPSKSPPPPPVQQSYQEPVQQQEQQSYQPQQPVQQSYQEPEPQQPVQQSYQEPQRPVQQQMTYQEPEPQQQLYQEPQRPVQQEQSYQEPEPQQPQQQEYQEPEPQQIEQQKEDQIPDEPQQQEQAPERKGRKSKPPAPKSRPPPPPPPPVKGQRVEPVQVPQVQQEDYPTKSEQPRQRMEARKVPEAPPPAPRKGSQAKKPPPRKPSPRPFLKPPPPTKAQPAPEEQRKRSRQVVTTPSTTTTYFDDTASFTGHEVTTESGHSYTDVGFDDDAASDEFRESDMPSKMPLDDVAEEEYNQTPGPRLASNSLREELRPRTVPPLRILPLSPANRARSSTPTRSASLRLASNNNNNNNNNEREEEDDDDDDEDDLLNDNRTPLSDVTEAPDIVATTLSSLTVRPNSFMRARFQQLQGNKNQQNSNLMFGDRLRSSNNNNNNNGNRNIDEDNYDEIDDENEELNEDSSSLSRKRRFEEFDSWEDETEKDDPFDSESSDKNLSVSPTPSTTPSSTSPVTSPISTSTTQEVSTTTEKYELPISHHETRFRRFIVKPGRKVRLLDGSLNLESSVTE